MRTLFLAAAVVLAAAPAGAQSADLLLLNGRVYTLDPARPWAEAVAIEGDRIAAVGTTADISARRGPSTRVIDLQGRFALPGFNDAHVHIDSTGSLLIGANLLDVHTAEPFTRRVAEAASRLPKGSWILRGDWGAYEQWSAGSAGAAAGANLAGPFTPSRALIDAVTPEHPVLVNRFDRSMFLANSRALTLAGIDDRTPNPDGGEIVRDARGRATGILKGSAAQLVRAVIPPIPFEQRLTQVRAVLKEAREGGVTTMQDLTSAEQLRVYQELHTRGELTSRIMLRPTLDNVNHIAALGITKGFGDDWLTFIGYKAWVDGIMGGSSAMFFRPYDHDPTNKGQLRPIMRPEAEDGAADAMQEGDHYTSIPPGNLEKLLMAAVGTGLTPHIHAIGDKGNRIILDIFQRVLAPHDEMIIRDHRWRVIHAQVVHPDDVARFGTLRLVAEVNPYHVSDDMRWMEERIGAERSKGAYAFRALKDSGAVLIFGSDSPGTNAARYFLNPVYGLYAAVTRQTLTGEPKDGWFPDQRLTIEEAIEAYTKASAWASFEEDRKGMLKPGYFADIAVFDGNLIEIGKARPADLLTAKVDITIAGGKVVYER
ncbi:MAG TPA: amidohydrolase [Vicinamibacterales bacterium]|nr:amidohydrolase [Vicinamibacterales bacterium]